jgi:hypothetical protein
VLLLCLFVILFPKSVVSMYSSVYFIEGKIKINTKLSSYHLCL